MINNLPKIPYYKKYIKDLSIKEEKIFRSLAVSQNEYIKSHYKEMTIEQIILFKLIFNEKTSLIERKVFENAIVFYKNTFKKLKEVELSNITDKEVFDLKKYLDEILNFEIYVANELSFKFSYRVTVIKEDFLEKGKIRTPKYLTYPNLDIIKRNKVYNRANTNEKTVFYCSAFENVAIRETKPMKGELIIISEWENISGKPFNSYPISSSKVNNYGSIKALSGIKKTSDTFDPLLSEFLNMHIQFLSSEFVKDKKVSNVKRYEYLYSAYFSDKILTPNKEKGDMKDIDCIVYPSVAWEHKHDNLAVCPQAVKTKLKLRKAFEYEIIETYYHKKLKLNEMPVKLRLIRETYDITDTLIIWEDE